MQYAQNLKVKHVCGLADICSSVLYCHSLWLLIMSLRHPCPLNSQIIHAHQAVFLQSSNISNVQQETTITLQQTAGLRRPEVKRFCYTHIIMKIAANTKSYVWMIMHLKLYFYNKPTQCTTFFTLLSYHTSACFGPICSPSSGDRAYSVANGTCFTESTVDGPG
jgi:hypothetical protein